MLKKTKKIIRILLLLVYFSAITLSIFAILEKPVLVRAITANSGQTSTSFSYTPMEEIPGQAGTTTDFYTYISYVYNFGIGAVGIAAMIMIMIGGYMYLTSAGNNASMENAKGVITDAIIGILLAMASYLILYVINPDLVKITRIEPIPTTQRDLQTGTVAGSCTEATSGACTVTNLKKYFSDENAAKEASAICNAESGGASVPSGVDKCQPGGESVSWGLFQINISSEKIGGKNCPDAFSSMYTAKNHNCTIKNRKLYDECVALAKNNDINIKYAASLSKNGTSWNRWGANKKCKF